MSVTNLTGRNVVITGVVAGFTRHEAERFLAGHGAHVQSSVTKATDILIIGAKVGTVKTNKARALGVPVISWSDAIDLIAGHPVVTSPPPEPPTKINQPVAPQQGYRQVFPMLCKKADELPASGDWIYEIKWDGYRCVAHVNGSTILASRSGKDYFANGYEHIVAELDQMVVPCVLDGEICVLDEHGRSDLERLHKGDTASAKFVVFDLLEVQGVDIRNQTLRERKKLLSKILEGGTFVIESVAFEEAERDGLMQYAVEQGLEGIVAKRGESVYKEKARDAWLKIKLRCQQEFVIVGYTEGKGNRAGTAGAFLLAVNDGTKTKPKWTYVGDAGSGGTIDAFEAIRQETTRLAFEGDAAIDRSQFPKAKLKEITFVEPLVVIDVKFQRWTEDGKLWHPSIQGRRTDKQAKEVIRET